MINSISNKIVDCLNKENILEEDISIYLYGTRLLISNLLGTLLLLFIGIITNKIVESLIYEITMSTSRQILGGYHCKSYKSCILVYNCQTKVGTGVGYSQATCTGKYLKCVGFYDSTSEKYFVNNIITGLTSALSGSDGCYKGKVNASVSIYLKDYTSYSGCSHTHGYTKSLI